MLFVAQNTQILCQRVVLIGLKYRTLMRMLHSPGLVYDPGRKTFKGTGVSVRLSCRPLEINITTNITIARIQFSA